VILYAINFKHIIEYCKGSDYLYIQYSKNEIGKRIRSERKAAGFKSAASFGDKLNIGRSQVEQIEQGKRLPELETLVRMAEIFNCEIGYLLCETEYECKTRTKTDIQKETGLSERAVERLLDLQKATIHNKAFLMLINAMLEDDTFAGTAANALYALLSVPDSAFVKVSFLLENKDTVSSLWSNNVGDIRRLYAADLQNIIFKFIEQQFLDNSHEE